MENARTCGGSFDVPMLAVSNPPLVVNTAL
jgi:hypothetical protein